MDAMYTAEALATGAGRNGHAAVKGSDLDFALAIPKEMGGSGEGANPEQLFAAGYAACFHSALQAVARSQKVELGDSAVGARVGIDKQGQGFQLAVELEVSIPRPGPRHCAAACRRRPPSLPLLQRHPRQYRGHRQRRRRLAFLRTIGGRTKTQ